MKVVNGRTIPEAVDFGSFGVSQAINTLLDVVAELVGTLGATEDGDQFAFTPTTGTAFSITGTAGVGLNIGRGVTSAAIRVGAWKASQASGNAVVLATTMCDSADTSQLDVVSVFGESVADITSAYSAKVIRGRHLIYAAADTDFFQETYGVVGQLVVKNGSLNHYHSGIMGTFETSTLCHVVSGYSVGAISARLGGSGTTIASGGLLAGVSAIQHMSAFTNGGTVAGFATHKTAVGIAWPVGLYMQSGSVTQGINIEATAQAMYANVTAVAAAGSLTCSALCVYAAGQAGQNDVGIVAYLDATAKGQSTGNWTYGAGIWLNIDSSFRHAVDPAGWSDHEQLCPLSVGIYAPTAVSTYIDDCDVVYGIKAELVGAPTAVSSNGCYFAALNVSQAAATKTAIFFAHQGAAVGQTTAKSVAAGALALVCINGTMYYVNLYSA
jgi:hypothetical protein